ncbi:uncharacterized protein LOC108212695 [Daucus carota subsp. sativus]|uniref:uncharacterized protein LOC108212695 n=1 Tax=Daucus carota subsp. sativus TaxID=79200 RepID=UPI0007EFC6FE|nr:PREDICTED: uncharacterized protein LOC108212695 [Daucus carota subsp. sativus]
MEFSQVKVRHCDNHVTCSCKFFFRKGYLCRHSFAALHRCRVKQISRQFVKPRWSKNAIKEQHQFLGFSHISEDCSQSERIKLKRRRAWFEIQNFLNMADDDEDHLDLILSGVQTIHSSLLQKFGIQSPNKVAKRVDRFVCPSEQEEISVQNPEVSQNKGCGSRIKNSRELSREDRKKRKCSNCGEMVRHNARICPEPKKT